jgi:membrane fusion protein
MALFREIKYDAVPARIVIKLHSKKSNWYLVLFSISLLIILISALFFVEYKRRVKVTGRLAPVASVIRVLSSQSGVIAGGMPHEGRVVEKGNILFSLISERTTGLGSADAADLKDLALARTNLRNQRDLNHLVLTIQQQIKGTESNNAAAQLKILDGEINLQTKREAIYKDNYDRFEKLEAIGYVSSNQLSQKSDDLLNQSSRVSQLNRDRIALLNTIRNTSNIDAVSVAQQRIEDLRLANSDLDVQRESRGATTRREAIILAPITGTITAVQAYDGQTVNIGQPVLAIIPRGTVLIAKVAVPSTAIGFLKVGQVALMRYAAFPYQKFGTQKGRVTAINQAATEKNQETNSDPTYEVSISLDQQSIAAFGQRFDLKSDMALECDILTDSRTLIEWIFEPFFAIANK